MDRLKGKVAIVTGGSGGIGSATAEMFASEGATVIIHYGRSKEKAQELAANFSKRYKTTCVAIGADASNKAGVEKLVSQVYIKFGRIDILANFLGFVVNKETEDYWNAPFEKVPWQHFEDVLNVDLRGIVNFCQAVIPHMKRQKYGKIINISSTPAIAGHYKGHPFTAAKAANAGITKDLALELGRFGIRANAIAPGDIETGWSKTLSKSEYRAIPKENPLQRWGQPIDVARVALFLASELSDFVNGQTIIVDGGAVIR